MNLEHVFDDYPNSLFIVEPIIEDGISRDFKYIYVNDAFCLFLGRSREELVGQRFLEVYGEPGEYVWFDLFRDAAIYGKYRQVRDVSRVIDKHLLAEVFHVAPNRCCCIIRDFGSVTVNEDGLVSHEQEEELARKAYVDCLTGFYNRFYLQERCSEIMEMKCVGITYLDINNLKETNDTLGHHAGDLLIQDFSDKLREFYPTSEIYRMGGDEFLIFTPDVGEKAFCGHSDRVKDFFTGGRLSTAMGYKFCESLTDLWREIDFCDRRMYENKRKMKRLAQKQGEIIA